MEEGDLPRHARHPIADFVRRKWHSWILLNISWSSRWWYSTVHIVAITVGAGVLSLPTVMAYLRWEHGTMVVISFIVMSQICYWQLIEMHEMVPGRRFDRYHELGQYVLGKRIGFWLVFPLQAVVQIGVATVYVIGGATSLEQVFVTTLGFGASHKKLPFNLAFISVELLLSQLPHFRSTTWVSFIAAVTATVYSTLAWIIILLQQPQSPKPSHDYPMVSTEIFVFGVFGSVGRTAFAASAGQNIALEIQATIPSTTEHPSKDAMWRGMLVAYLIVSFCYVPVALVGFWYFGNSIETLCSKLQHPRDCHVLLLTERPTWMIVVANLMVFIHLCGSYQVYTMPLFENFDAFVEKKGFQSTFVSRMVMRSVYVGKLLLLLVLNSISLNLVKGLTLSLATKFPHFEDLQALIGGLAIVPTTYLIPSVLWHLTRKPKTLTLAWIASLFLMALGLVIMLSATVGALWNIAERRSSRN